MKKIIIKNMEDTEVFGKRLASKLEPGDIVALVGDLGTGKTTLSKAVARGLGVTEPITSPTFNIVQEYRTGRLPLYHFDVYRLKGEADFLNIGGDEYFNQGGICLIEWADIIADVLPENTKVIFMEYSDVEGERIYQCTF